MKYSVKEHPTATTSDKLKMENFRGPAPARQKENVSTYQAFDDSVVQVRLLNKQLLLGFEIVLHVIFSAVFSSCAL